MGEAERVSLHQLIIHRVLGQGATGTVFLAAFLSRPSHPPFALKIVHPESAREDALRRAQWEVEVLSLLLRHPHPFLPSLFATLDDADLPNSLPGWAIPFCPTGDLNALRYLQTDRVFSVAAIRFYAAEILLALSHLHSLRIVYRDLKPENVLIRESGHLMLADFDLSKLLLPAVTSSSPPQRQQPLTKEAHDHIEKKQKTKPRHRRSLTRFLAAASAKVSPISHLGIRRRSSFAGETALPVSEVVEKTYSFVGTEEYVAPEMVRGDGHGFPVDWWGFGVLLYEMMYGMTPFKGGTRKETFHNVLHQPPEFMGPASTSTAPLRDLIKRLLEKDPERRLGSRGGGEEIKAHSFFRGLDWDGIGELSRPPYLSMASDDEEEEAAEFCGGGAGVQLHASGCEMGIDVREFFRKRTAERPPPRRRGAGKSSGSNYSPVIPAAHLAPHSSPVSCAVGCMELDEAELHGGDLSFS